MLINAFTLVFSSLQVCEVNNFKGGFLMLQEINFFVSHHPHLLVVHSSPSSFVIHAFNGFYLINFQKQSLASTLPQNSAGRALKSKKSDKSIKKHNPIFLNEHFDEYEDFFLFRLKLYRQPQFFLVYTLS